MKTYQSSLRLMSWITIAALLTMLWSGTATAVVPDTTSQTPWGEICSVNAKGIDAGTSGAGHSKDSLHVHCAFCCKQNAMYVLPTRFDIVLAAPAGWALPAANRKAIPILSEAWLTLPSRGPPAIC
ncbi:DUF2946 family protein [Herbaspirillum sp. RV1423]|uniref:DUF2946 family protein n=1 Tax=Herbaspirillum sp. RV1423 TaxID=1443993 RepID=UPI0004B856F4|nr:DUF2946 family protein [Herbaspirillum sp. RV1423]